MDSIIDCNIRTVDLYSAAAFHVVLVSSPRKSTQNWNFTRPWPLYVHIDTMSRCAGPTPPPSPPTRGGRGWIKMHIDTSGAAAELHVGAQRGCPAALARVRGGFWLDFRAAPCVARALYGVATDAGHRRWRVPGVARPRRSHGRSSKCTRRQERSAARARCCSTTPDAPIRRGLRPPICRARPHYAWGVRRPHPKLCGTRIPIRAPSIQCQRK